MFRRVVFSLLVSGFFLLFFPVVYGQNVSYDECSLVQVFLDEQGVVKEQFLEPLGSVPSEDTYPIGAVKLAIEHLQAACCQKQRLSSEQCPIDSLSKDFPPQRMLFRQIMDIGMRRMDGYAEGLYGHDELLDPLAKSWRTFLETQGRAVNGTPPQIIINKFAEAVGPTNGNATYVATPVVYDDSSIKQCDSLQDYDMLSQRIQQQCAIAYCVTEELYTRAELTRYDFAKQGLQAMYRECLAIQQDRLLDEYKTTNAIIQAQAAIMQQRAQENYLVDYVVSRMRELSSKVIKWVSGLEIVNTKYTEGTKHCN